MTLPRGRFDYVLVWGHGMPHLHGILEVIHAFPGLDVLRVQEHAPRSVRRLVRAVYSYDYAPFRHLKAKTRYLETTPGRTAFLFLRNHRPEEDYHGQGAFRHVESRVMRRLKEALRERFNPRDAQGARSEDHVIHASDSEAQTDYILKYLGHRQGIGLFRPPLASVPVPYFLPAPGALTVRRVELAALRCTLLTDDGGVRTAPVARSPHALALAGDEAAYLDYVARHLGRGLTADHDLARHKAFAATGRYLAPPHETSYILVQDDGQGLVVRDGLHRAAALLHQGQTHAIAGVLP